MIPCPKLDERTPEMIAEELRSLLQHFVAEFPRRQNEPFSEAMVQIFARFSEILIDRLNRAPQKNFLAFLDLIGLTNLPQRASRVPITFYLSPGHNTPAIVPARTLLSAQPFPGEKQSVVFETEHEFVAAPIALASLVVKDGKADAYADLTALAPSAPPKAGAPTTSVPAAPLLGQPAFHGTSPMTHVLYIGLTIASPIVQIDKLTLKFVINDSPNSKGRKPLVGWEMCIPAPKQAPKKVDDTPQAVDPDLGILTAPLTVSQDGTDNLSKSGDIVFELPPPIPLSSVQGIALQWLRCRLMSSISQESNPAANELMANQLPRVTSLAAEFDIDRKSLQMDAAFYNAMPLDTSKDFFPFGERPRFGDTLYLACQSLFSSPEAVLTLHIEVTNGLSSVVNKGIATVTPHDVQISWEVFDGTEWLVLGISGSVAPIVVPNREGVAVIAPFLDDTLAFSKSGDVTFTLPKTIEKTTVNGKSNWWLRVRIVSGNYGHDMSIHQNLIRTSVDPQTFAAPVIHSLRSDYSIKTRLVPDALIASNNFAFSKLDPVGPFQPFKPVASEELTPALYFGFLPTPASPSGSTASPSIPTPQVGSTPANIKLPSFPLSLYLDLSNAPNENIAIKGSSSMNSLRWDYWNGTDWIPTPVLDDTHGCRRPGMIRFLSPPDFALSREFGLDRYWMRAVPIDASNSILLNGALINTTMAQSGTTVINDLLGVSNGMPGQTFKTREKPVLPGQHLEVMEPRLPDAQERAQICSLDGQDAVTVLSLPGGEKQIWVRWRQVENFYGSRPRDRHYMLDRPTGTIYFGDGSEGLIPLRGGSIRIASYRAGGGSSGNRPSFNITQLKTAVPYVAKVCNWTVADGGGDAEELPALIRRGSRGLRHGGRAVTVQDYEDLAILASPEVARATCLPLADLSETAPHLAYRPGAVSVAILPRKEDPRPQPNSELLEAVLTFLQQASPPAVQLTVAGPEFRPVDLSIDLAINAPELATRVLASVQDALSRFLHPVTGGEENLGWPFGRRPHTSDFYRLVEAVHGVHHIRNLSILGDIPPIDRRESRHTLVCAGNFQIITTVQD